MEDINRIIRAFDLFCGAGGSSCGADQAGIEIVVGVDLWDRAAETFELNFPQATVYQRRLDRRLTARSVAREVGPVELLLASPECTNHSVAKGSAPRDEESRLPPDHPNHVPPGYSAPDNLPPGHPAGEYHPDMPPDPVIYPIEDDEAGSIGDESQA